MNWKADVHHVYPLNDEREHVLEGGTCWCKPRLDWVPSAESWKEPMPLFVHHAADCRELIEEAEAIKHRVENAGR